MTGVLTFPSYTAVHFTNTNPGDLLFIAVGNELKPILMVKSSEASKTHALIELYGAFRYRSFQSSTEDKPIFRLNSKWRFKLQPIMNANRELSPRNVKPGFITHSLHGVLFQCVNANYSHSEECCIELKVLNLVDVSGDSIMPNCIYSTWAIEIREEASGHWETIWVPEFPKNED